MSPVEGQDVGQLKMYVFSIELKNPGNMLSSSFFVLVNVLACCACSCFLFFFFVLMFEFVLNFFFVLFCSCSLLFARLVFVVFVVVLLCLCLYSSSCTFSFLLSPHSCHYQTRHCNYQLLKSPENHHSDSS